MTANEDFFKRGKELSLKIVKLLQEEANSHDDASGNLIGLFAVAKVSASVIKVTQQVLEDDEEILELFMSELNDTLNSFDALITSDEVIKKAMGKP